MALGLAYGENGNGREFVGHTRPTDVKLVTGEDGVWKDWLVGDGLAGILGGV